MPHFTPKAFIFDCDGTLVNSEEPGIQVIHQLAKDLGVEMGLEEAMASIHRSKNGRHRQVGRSTVVVSLAVGVS
jgi:beta-phosphoglucomutase-like phosphatase (HAD superfamily)